MTLKTSVGRRLLTLVSCQTAIAALLIFTAVQALSSVVTDKRQTYRFQVQSITEIGTAMEVAARLESLIADESFGASSPTRPAEGLSLLEQLDNFEARYRIHWEVVRGNTPDAVRFRTELLEAGDLGLLEKEARTLKDLDRSLAALKNDTDPAQSRWMNARKIREDLAALYNVKVAYSEIARQNVNARTRTAQFRLVTIGVLGTLLTLLLGLSVHRAISPRIRRLVRKVDRFRELGVNENVVETGKDEIAVLANALEKGFSAIAARERERTEFLAIAAHELKTPVTSIQGYTSLLLSHPEKTSILPRALQIIHRQSWRLSRLTEDLFLAMRAKTGKLQFEPGPLDMSALVSRVVSELAPLISSGPFRLHCKPDINILGDDALLEHALWSLLSCASALSESDARVDVRLNKRETWATLSVDVMGSNVSAGDLEALFTPFQTLEYECGGGIRCAVGLYLCREIVRVHNGILQVRQMSKGLSEFVMELPA